MSPRPLLLVIALCACSGNVDVDGLTTGSGGTGGETAASGGSGGVAGSGAVGGSSGSGVFVGSGGSGGATTSTGGGGSGGDCTGYVQLDVDGPGEGPELFLDWSCGYAPPVPGASGELGYTGGKGGSQVLLVTACSKPDNQGVSTANLSFQADLTGVGATTSGQAELTLDGPGQTSFTNDISVKITDFGPVGGTITGDVDFTIFSANGTPQPIHGKLAVCRSPDGFPAP